MANKILVVNSGSSSIKFKLFEQLGNTLQAAVNGIIERVGEPTESSITLQGAHGKRHTKAPIKTHLNGLEHAFGLMQETVSQSIADEVAAVGHRIVHGGRLSTSCLLDANARAEVQRAATFAPLHNPAHLVGIEACEAYFSGRPQIGVFDTAFHQTMPKSAYMYALPYNLHTHHGVRRYGMHGTSYRFLLHKLAESIRRPEHTINAIFAHLGAGSSMCCVRAGKSIDTSMGMTPLEGLVMATRCGDIDPGMLPFLSDKLNLDVNGIDDLLNKRSGLLGLSGHMDLRTIIEGAQGHNERCLLALQVFHHRVRKYLGAYYLTLGGEVDAVVFSAGIGEHSAATRAAVCLGLSKLGIVLDVEKNEAAEGTVDVAAAESRVRVFVIPTDEEMLIARDTASIAGMSL